MSRIYLDYSAAAPLRPAAAAAMRACLEAEWGNASSVHWAGSAARAHLRRSRGSVAAALGAAPGSVVFTSGATEANAMVFAGVGSEPGRDTVVTCAAEHASVLGACELLRERGLRVVELGLEPSGVLDPDRFEAALDSRVALASIHWVNNETGVVQPIAELGRRAAAAGVPMHTDAAQAVGKLRQPLSELPVDFASISAHKLGGPPGIGALYVAPGRVPEALMRGGGQEQGLRPGTENLPGIVGFAAACEELPRELDELPRVERLRDLMWDEIAKRIPDVQRNAMGAPSISQLLNVSFEGASGEALVEALDLEGIAVSSGSACHAGSREPSHVLLAMGYTRRRSSSALRISLGADTSAQEVERFLEVLPAIVARVREAGG